MGKQNSFIPGLGNNRARQFIPFMALKGFKELLQEVRKESQRETKQELWEEEKERLQCLLATLQPGQQILVNYYSNENGNYIRLKGRVRYLDRVRKLLVLKESSIALENIAEIVII